MVVVPSLGRRVEFLRRALESCRELSEFSHCTISVVLPPGAARARELADEFGALVLTDPGRGMSAAVNVALGRRTGEDYYIWLGDDDELVASGIRKLVSSLDADPSAVLAFGFCEYINENGQPIGVNRAGLLARNLLPWGPNLLPHPGTVVRIDSILSVGGLDESLRYVMDLDLFLRLRRIGKFLHSPVLASRFRWHPDSATVESRSSSSREAMRVKTKHLSAFPRFFAPLWNYPVAWASQFAAWLVSRRARQAR